MTNERPIQWKTIERHIACVCERVWRAAMIIAHSTIPYFNPPEAAPPPTTARRGNFYLPARAWHYTTLLLCLLHCIRCLRKIQPLEVLLLLTIVAHYCSHYCSHFLPRYVLLKYITLTHRLHYDVIMLNVIMMQIYVGIHWYTLPNANLSQHSLLGSYCIWDTQHAKHIILFSEICPVCRNL